MENCKLPVEILDLIIQYIPDQADNSIALSSSHIVTKTLYSCLFVSKTTFASSLEQLYKRCAYIDSAGRLRALVRSYSSTFPIFGRNVAEPAQFRNMATTSLYLAPFSSDTIDESLVVAGINQLFDLLAENVQKLVIDMPLRSYYPDEPGSANLRSVLRSAFLKLKNVEEFVSIRDELYLSTAIPHNYHLEPPVWSSWKHTLRRLALYNLSAGEEIVRILNESMPALKDLILTRPDFPDITSALRNPDLVVTLVNTWRDLPPERRRSTKESWNPARPFGSVATWHRKVRGVASRIPAAAEPDEFQSQSRTSSYNGWLLLDIIIVDGQDPVTDPRGSHHHAGSGFRGNNWAAYDLRHTFNDIRVCQEWVKGSALKGCLVPPELVKRWSKAPLGVEGPFE